MKHFLKLIVLIGFVLFLMEKTFRLFIALQPDESEYTTEDEPSEKPNNGVYKQVDENGNLISIQYYTEGKRDSSWTYFYPNGNIRSIVKYNENVLHGKAKYFSQEGGLIYEERYTKGKLVEVNVKNDSLYKYNVQLHSHGKLLYHNTCTPCHESVTHNAVNPLKSLRDSLSAKQLSLDSMHYHFTDSVTIRERIISVEHQNRVFNRFDIDAIIHFLQIEKDKSKQLPFRGIKSLKDRSKTVYHPHFKQFKPPSTAFYPPVWTLFSPHKRDVVDHDK